jgi:hypothetical protein
MSRRARVALFALVASLVLSTAACTDLAGPAGVDHPSMDEHQGSGT